MENRDNGSSSGKPRRRPRYPGKNPRRFEHKYKELAPEKYPGIVEHVMGRGKTPAGSHVPVLLAEVLEALDPKPGETAADCTVGHGGHAEALIDRLGPGGALVGLDVDGAELERTMGRLEGRGGRVLLFRRNFAGLASAALEAEIPAFDLILADLGVSSMQLDDPSRGFSYKSDGPLDMRMDSRKGLSAAGLLATIAEKELSKALLDLADEPDHAAIAGLIAQRRAVQPLRTTADLAGLVLEAKGMQRRRRGEDAGKTHPAARTFQAVRMLVNDELKNLKRFLDVAPGLLSPGGRIAVISFHSGEDRLVKKAFEAGLAAGVYSEISREPVRPSHEELRSNPRSAPARLRRAKTSDCLKP